MPIQHETELYLPIKAFLEEQGYEVRGEVKHCDLMALRQEEEPVIVELKRTFNLPLLIQGLDRLRSTDQVYVAVEMTAAGKAPYGLSWGDVARLCRRLGLGLITVRFYKTKRPLVQVHCDPDSSYIPRKTSKRTQSLLTEFRERSADYNIGGSHKRKLITAYREKALHCACALDVHGPLTTARLKEITGSAKVVSILQKNFYGWYRRVRRGTYELTPTGQEALKQYEAVVKDLPV